MRRTQRFAEEMRREGTRAERALGRLLNAVDGGRLRGSFVREWAFDRWILDVYFWERRVGIEVDGGCHRNAEVRRRDLLKERACRKKGIVLIRMTNEEVLSGDGAVVLRKLREAWIRAAVRDRISVGKRVMERSGENVVLRGARASGNAGAGSSSRKESFMSGVTEREFLNVFMVEDYKAEGGKKASRWTKVGVAFPHREGMGFNVELQAFPRDGRLVVLPPKDHEEGSSG